MTQATPRGSGQAAGDRVDLGDIQGNILRAYRFPVATHLFIHFHDPNAGRAWLGAWLDSVTTAQPWPEGHKPAATFNLAFTAPGLHALGVPEEVMAAFSPEFRAGMAARAAALGDTGPSAPSGWDAGWTRGEVHAMVAVHSRSQGDLGEAVQHILGRIPAPSGPRFVARQDAGRLPEGREHFGFSDGFGQPWVSGPESGRVFHGQGTPDGKGGWKPVALGEFLLGHPDEEGVHPDASIPMALARNGTYLLYRKLSQDVSGFRAYVAAQAQRLGLDPARIGAAVVGRWEDGSPLVLSPERADPGLGRSMARNNDFLYGEDLQGFKCPVGAHVRRANPRDALGFTEQMVSRHRMIRRGISYGPPLARGAPDDGLGRGLLFMACVASLKRQFEVVQSQWLNDGNVFHLGADRDVIAGDNDGTGKMTIQGSPPRFLAAVPQLVATRGGDYFFSPGLDALRHLAAGSFAATG